MDGPFKKRCNKKNQGKTRSARQALYFNDSCCENGYRIKAIISHWIGKVKICSVICIPYNHCEE